MEVVFSFVFLFFQAMQRLVSAGGTAAKSVKEAALEAEIVITMLPSSPHVQEVYQQILASLRPGTLCIDSSTIDPAVARSVAASLEKAGSAMIDAPVSGGVSGAEGILTHFVFLYQVDDV